MNEMRQPSAKQVQEARRFAVFISYSHRDESLAGWLHRKLEGYHVPRDLVGKNGAFGPIPARLGRCFRDRDDLSASGNLSDAIRDALVNSDAMLVLCSPSAATSPYVSEEIRTFKALGKGHRILAAISSGEPHAASRAGFFAADECFPPALLRQVGPDGSLTELPEGREPLAADFRERKDERDVGKLKLMAGLLGVGLDDLVQRERVAQRWRMRVTACLAVMFALLALAAVGFGLWSEHQRMRSEANRLALESQLASELDQSLLLAVAAYKTSPSFQTDVALFSALTRRPKLDRFLHGSNGPVRSLLVLPDQIIVGLAGRDSGELSLWDLTKPRPERTLITGVQAGVAAFALAARGTKLVVARKFSIELFDFNLSARRATLIQQIPTEEVAALAGHVESQFVYAGTAKGKVITFDVALGKAIREEPSPERSLEYPVLRLAPDGSTLALQTKGGIWLRRGSVWRRLSPAPAAGQVFIDAVFDSAGEHLASASGLDQNWYGREDDARKTNAFRCWKVADGTLASECPQIGGLASPGGVGSISADAVLLSTRDLRTKADVTEYWLRKGSKWTASTLRADATFVTGLAETKRGALMVGTVDQELGLYALDRLGPGESRQLKDEGQVLLLRWTESGCRLILRTGRELRLYDCLGAPAITKNVRFDFEANVVVGPRAARDQLSLEAVDARGNLIIWDSALTEVVRAPPPPGISLAEAGREVVYAPKCGCIFLSIGTDEIWRFDIQTARWRLFAHSPFKIRTLGFGGAGVLFAGDANGGGIAAFDAQSGSLKFSIALPGGQFVTGIFADSRGEAVYVAALTGRRSLYKLDARTGALLSDDFNRFPGPAKILAVSPDSQFLIMQGVGFADQKLQKNNDSRAGAALELWDAQRLLPLGDGFRLREWDWFASFDPTSNSVVLAPESSAEFARLPLDRASWMATACRMAGRDLGEKERERFRIAAENVCAVEPNEAAPSLPIWP
ncbi:toll/interleukin-1 receptor domain-containing protein [Bradyrhizobium sp. 38]|uniref:toll/interleukin-1 receptor domain-containing protein n=1 Tax=unclassified Bradyrhizobium TaxID=2631580 RepID=UPI001FF77FD2|nr:MULTISPECIES: toll/interleukin-1 receptor domain-containing protein [unclassified Bradyrhizobium]MCK1338636.1 toll/interleukin-1 receptor domain-containing protein [Bradyrhizobium sp. 38]MCK1776042.1 toll/interleukin-1 receptor domain-containing protein [Bradyrhizobium sp. 132]